MENVTRQIAVTKENREFLSRAFKITSVMVWKALNYKSDTTLAKKIRKVAIERGGVELVICPVGKNPMDCVETLHDSDGYMRQYFPNGAMVEFSKEDGTGNVFFKGESCQHYEDVRVSEIESIQNYAMALV